MKLVVFGLSLSSSWGNGHATTYRALLAAFAARGHDVLFLERDRPWYAAERDLLAPSYCRLALYPDISALAAFDQDIATADAVMIGSYVPDAVPLAAYVFERARGARVFYDIDTPVTLARLKAGDCEYLTRETARGFDLYLSFTGGPILRRIEREFGVRRAEALHCSVDTDAYAPRLVPKRFDLGYLGTYSPDRQEALERLLIEPARRAPERAFVVGGPLYPVDIDWPANVLRLDHVGPADHPAFYAACRFTLNVTRADMIRAGWSPSVRLFEAAACGTAILSDHWAGLDQFFAPGRDIVLARTSEDVLDALAWPDARIAAIGAAGRARVLEAHTARHRAAELEVRLQQAIIYKSRGLPSRILANVE